MPGGGPGRKPGCGRGGLKPGSTGGRKPGPGGGRNPGPGGLKPGPGRHGCGCHPGRTGGGGRQPAMGGGGRLPHQRRSPYQGPVAVVVGPVAADREADDRHPDQRAIGRQRHALVLVGVVEVARPDPAALAVGQHHVAPAVAVGTADHVERLARRQLRHQRIVARGAGAQVDGAAGEGLLRLRRERQGQGQGERADTDPAQGECVHGEAPCAPA
jgi:hypothetical protein